MQSVNSLSVEAINRKPMIKNIPFYPDPTYRPPPKPISIPKSEGQENIDISPEINIQLRGQFSISGRSNFRDLSKMT